MVVSFKIEGINKTLSNLNFAQKRMSQGVNSEIHKQGFLLEGEVKQSIAGHKSEPRSVDTGLFLRSINTRNNFLSSTVSTDVEYAPFLEMGTRRLQARKHFQNSAKRRTPFIVNGIKERIK